MLRVESPPFTGRYPQIIRHTIVYWHLLSLDAPTVAMLWTWFIARTYRIYLSVEAILAIGVAVWILYASDRLLDARGTNLQNAPQATLEPRHHFHHKHQTAFRFGIAFCSVILALLLTQIAPSPIRLYATLAIPLAAYFALIHMRKTSATSRPKRHLPKEIAVGVFFSAATFIPTVARAPMLRSQLLPSAILFGLVCSLNCLFIYSWEHPFVGSVAVGDPDTHPLTRYAIRHLLQLSSFTVLGSLGVALSLQSPAKWPLPTAIALAAALLILLHRNRRHFEATTLRASADLCLLTPVILALILIA
jgi:hypothetical protein